MGKPLEWYDHQAIKALAEVRRLAPREGWRYQHVQAIIVTIDHTPKRRWQSRVLLEQAL